MIRIGMFFAEGFEEAEAIVPADMLRRAGIDVRLVSITGRKEVTGSHKITVTTDMLFDKKECESFDMLVLPGGMLMRFIPFLARLSSSLLLLGAIVNFCQLYSFFLLLSQ